MQVALVVAIVPPVSDADKVRVSGLADFTSYLPVLRPDSVDLAEKGVDLGCLVGGLVAEALKLCVHQCAVDVVGVSAVGQSLLGS